LLLDGGATVDARNDAEDTPLHLAAWNGNVATCRLLLERGADIRALDGGGRNAVHYAVSGNHIDICRFLVEQGADYTARNVKSKTPLEMAERTGRRDFIVYLRSLPGR
jgi:ankyrin repeat protein